MHCEACTEWKIPGRLGNGARVRAGEGDARRVMERLVAELVGGVERVCVGVLSGYPLHVIPLKDFQKWFKRVLNWYYVQWIVY